MSLFSLLFIRALFICIGVSNCKNGVEGSQLPLRLDCNVSSSTQQGKCCHKGDLIDESIADCSKTPSIYSCDPVDKVRFSTSVGVPDVDAHGVNCVPVSGKPVRCGDTDTRCVCDAPVDVTSKLRRPYIGNHCRCQYWPSSDIHDSQPAVCKQYDHGGVSGLHFFTCCDNCNDLDTSCDGDTYQGGGTTDKLCGTCGNRVLFKNSKKCSRHTYTFNCGSCWHQRQCRNHCNNNEPCAKVLPGLCPKWTGCFRDCCLNVQNPSNREKRFEL